MLHVYREIDRLVDVNFYDSMEILGSRDADRWDLQNFSEMPT